MLSDEERLRVYGGPAGVAAADAYIADLVASFPPLTPQQRARLAVLFRPVAPLRSAAAPGRSVGRRATSTPRKAAA